MLIMLHADFRFIFILITSLLELFSNRQSLHINRGSLVFHAEKSVRLALWFFGLSRDVKELTLNVYVCSKVITIK